MYFCPVTVLGLHCSQRGTMWSSNQSLAWRQPQTYDDKPNHGMPCLASTRHASQPSPCHAMPRQTMPKIPSLEGNAGSVCRHDQPGKHRSAGSLQHCPQLVSELKVDPPM